MQWEMIPTETIVRARQLSFVISICDFYTKADINFDSDLIRRACQKQYIVVEITKLFNGHMPTV